MNNVNRITTEDFNREVLQASVPVLVDFYADWCGPCRMLSPILEKVAAQYAGRVKVVKVDVDREPSLAEEFNVSSIPTLVFVHEGEVVGRTSGLLSEGVLVRAFEQLVGQSSIN